MNIGKKIKEFRKYNKMTQEDLADKLKISRSALALYETGKRQVPNDLLPKLAKELEVNINEFFE